MADLYLYQCIARGVAVHANAGVGVGGVGGDMSRDQQQEISRHAPQNRQVEAPTHTTTGKTLAAAAGGERVDMPTRRLDE